MKNIIIKRESVLNLILKRIKNYIKQNQAGIIEIYGDAGCGKSTISNQIEEYFNYFSIFPQINKINGIENFSIYNYLTSLSNINNSNMELDDSELFPQLSELLLRTINYQKDIQILIIDDAHFLSNEVIEQLKCLFNKYNGLSNFFLILSGREKRLDENSIEVRSFSENELKSVFNQYLDNNWIKNNSDIYKWIIGITKGWPVRRQMIWDKIS
jgi:type II secretory pathway predicted ATPase ExeA